MVFNSYYIGYVSFWLNTKFHKWKVIWFKLGLGWIITDWLFERDVKIDR